VTAAAALMQSISAAPALFECCDNDEHHPGDRSLTEVCGAMRFAFAIARRGNAPNKSEDGFAGVRSELLPRANCRVCCSNPKVATQKPNFLMAARRSENKMRSLARPGRIVGGVTLLS
jgi:hypothetical protein